MNDTPTQPGRLSRPSAAELFAEQARRRDAPRSEAWVVTKTMHLFAGAGGGIYADYILGHEPEGWKKSGTGQVGPCDNGVEWWSVEPGMGRVVDGMTHRRHRIKCLGNGQVPLQAATAHTILKEIMRWGIQHNRAA